MFPEHEQSSWFIKKNGGKNMTAVLVDIDQDAKKTFKADFKVIPCDVEKHKNEYTLWCQHIQDPANSYDSGISDYEILITPHFQI